jgi:hypothetical protein
MGLRDLKARFESSEFEPGAWFKANDAAIGGPGKPARRFVLVARYEGGPSVRMAPRSSQTPPPSVKYVAHLAHPSRHESGCAIGVDGYITLRSNPIHFDDIASYSCHDPDDALVAKLRQAARALGGRI